MFFSYSFNISDHSFNTLFNILSFTFISSLILIIIHHLHHPNLLNTFFSLLFYSLLIPSLTLFSLLFLTYLTWPFLRIVYSCRIENFLLRTENEKENVHLTGEIVPQRARARHVAVWLFLTTIFLLYAGRRTTHSYSTADNTRVQ